MKKIIISVCILIVLALVSSPVMSSVNHGLPNFDLKGGDRGLVPFPHNQHQLSIQCNECHSFFPKHIGAIEKLISDGVLSKRYIMNKLCIACHKKNAQQENKTGPVKCKNCHVD